jgi:hypothetical protein
VQHKVVLYDGPERAFKGRWICICKGVLMPRVPFGHPLNQAFSEHLKEVERHDAEAARA